MKRKFPIVLILTLMFTLLISSFVFADTVNITLPSGTGSSSPYYFVQKVDTTYYLMYYTCEMKLDSNDTSTSHFIPVSGSGTCYYYQSSDGVNWTYKSSWGVSSSGDNDQSGTSIVYSNFNVTKLDGSVFFQAPYSLKQVATKPLGNLTTVFGANLVTLLVVGVAVLSILLGVFLIPRLVHLFL